MLAYIREGDIVLVTELDRLGRNNQDLTKIMHTIKNKGTTLDVLNLLSMTGDCWPPQFTATHDQPHYWTV